MSMKSKCSCYGGSPSKDGGSQSPGSGRWIRHGVYFRKGDSLWVQRWQCRICLKTCSQATHSSCYGQKKRRINPLVERGLCSGVTQRRLALVLGVNRKTVVRKFLFLASQSQNEHRSWLQSKKRKESEVYFDEMESHEVTKWKPLSIAIAVNEKREILAVEVSRMPARGKEAAKARVRYGYRKDERRKGIQSLLKTLQPLLILQAKVLTDEKPLYRYELQRHPSLQIEHHSFKGRRSCIVGQGELKKIGRDPLFALNHTAAMLRANINRLIRRTWSVTQKPERLLAHIYLYMKFHNQVLLNN